MKRGWFLVFSVLMITISCNSKEPSEEHAIEEHSMIGYWEGKNPNVFFVFNDSLNLTFGFAPYSKWKLREDTLSLLYPVFSHGKDSIWNTFKIKKESNDTVILKSLDDHFIYDEMVIYKRTVNSEKQNFRNLNLIISSCLFDDDCTELDIRINLNNREVYFSNPNDSINRTCSISVEQTQVLHSMLNQIEVEGIEEKYMSNEVGAKYFTLKAEAISGGENLETIIDSGGKAPELLERIALYAWATSQLNCLPDGYNKLLRGD